MALSDMADDNTLRRIYPYPQCKDVTVIKAFEAYEDTLEASFGESHEDFMPWFECFMAGFEAGGCS